MYLLKLVYVHSSPYLSFVKQSCVFQSVRVHSDLMMRGILLCKDVAADDIEQAVAFSVSPWGMNVHVF